MIVKYAESILSYILCNFFFFIIIIFIFLTFLARNFFVENWEEWAKDHGKSSKIFFFLLFFILGVPKKSEFYFLNSIFIAIFSIYDPKSTFIKGNLIEHKSEWKLDVCICVEGDAVSSKGEIMWRNWAWINVCAFYRFSLAFVSRSYCKITFTQGAHTRILWDGERERESGDNLIHHIKKFINKREKKSCLSSIEFFILLQQPLGF